jgi:hypothetical protein
MTSHRLLLSISFQDQHTPITFPFHTRIDAEKYQKGDRLTLIAHDKVYDVKVSEWFKDAAGCEMALSLA